MWELDYKESWAQENWCFCTVALKKTLKSHLGLKDIKPVNPKGNQSLNIHWKDWCWSWNSNTLATWCEELTPWKRAWCWERSKAGGEGDNRGWDGWMASLTQWTWVWASWGSWWWIGKPGVLQSMGSDRTEQLNWTEGSCAMSEAGGWYDRLLWCGGGRSKNQRRFWGLKPGEEENNIQRYSPEEQVAGREDELQWVWCLVELAQRQWELQAWQERGEDWTQSGRVRGLEESQDTECGISREEPWAREGSSLGGQKRRWAGARGSKTGRQYRDAECLAAEVRVKHLAFRIVFPVLVSEGSNSMP